MSHALLSSDGELLDELDTGDVLLYRTNDFGAHINACVQGDQWSHVGLIVEATPELEQLYSADYASCSASSPVRARLAVFEAVPKRGVSLFPLEARLARTVGSLKYVSARRLSKTVKGAFSASKLASLYAFMKEVGVVALVAPAICESNAPNHISDE